MPKLRYITLKQADNLRKSNIDFACKYLLKLATDKITPKSYLTKMRSSDGKTKYSKLFHNITDFKKYLKITYPSCSDIDGIVNHEKQHFDHAIQNGLLDTKVGVIEISTNKGIFIDCFTMVYTGKNFQGWTAEQILMFERTNSLLGASDSFSSDSDKYFSDFIKNLKPSK